MEENKYIRTLFAPQDETLTGILDSVEKQNMPTISVPTEVGRMITIITQMSGARRALEIGTLGGYSALHILRGMPDVGTLTSLEFIPKHAELAKQNLTAAGYGHQVTFHTKPALESLQRLREEGASFDLFLIDADKANYETYLDHAIALAEPGAVILADNTLQGGRVCDEDADDKKTAAMKAFNKKAAQHPKLDAMLIPIGDGLLVARVRDD